MRIKKRTGVAILISMMLMAVLVLADQESTTVTFVVPTDIDHSLSYGNSCSSANFFFVENDATIDGTQAQINASSDNAGANTCQNSTLAAITISNIGSTVIDVYMNITAAYPSGANLKAALADGGYEAACSGTVAAGTCGDIPAATTGILVANAIAAQSGTEEVWLWANMSNFNSGAAGEVTRTLQTTAEAD